MKTTKNSILNLKSDFHHYKEHLRSLYQILFVLLVTGTFLFLVLFFFTGKHVSELGNARIATLNSKTGALFDALERLSLSLSEKSNVKSTSELYDPTMDSLDELQKKLPIPCIDQVLVFDQNHNIVKTDHGAYTSQFFPDVLALVGETTEGFQEALAQAENGPVWMVGQLEGPSLYCLAKIISNTPYDVQYILISLSIPVLENYLEYIDLQSYQFIAFKNCYISSAGSARTEEPADLKAIASAVSGKKVRCFFDQGDFFSCAVAIPMQSYYLNQLLVLLCFLFSVLVLLLLESNNFIRYRKLNEEKRKELLQSLSEKIEDKIENENSQIAVSIYDEIHRYQNAAELHSLENRSRNIRHVLFEHFQNTPSQEMLDNSGIDGSCAVFFVASFFIDDYSDMFFDQREPGENVKAAHMVLQSTMVSLTAPEDTVTSCSINGNCSAIFCIKEKAQAEEKVIAILQQTIDFVEQNYGLTICTVLSNAVSSPEKLCRAYKKTCKTYRFAQTISTDSAFIICSKQKYSASLVPENDFLKQIQVISNTILMQNYDLIPDMSETLIQQTIIPLTDNVELAQSRLMTLANLLAEAIMKCNISEEEAYDYASRFVCSDSVQALRENIRTIFPEIGSREVEKKDTLTRACDFIHDHIGDPNLSVILICDTLNISKQYLSRAFKQKLNKTVSGYINEYRINYSKQLLSTTAMNVAEIAAAVGYTTPDTYTRNFKKVENITPTEFRRLL